jgi:hypothetical protein
VATHAAAHVVDDAGDVVTLTVAAELVPAASVAVTENVYAVLAASPLTVALVAVLVTVDGPPVIV